MIETEIARVYSNFLLEVARTGCATLFHAPPGKLHKQQFA
jgi:hypothetical protein